MKTLERIAVVAAVWRPPPISSSDAKEMRRSPDRRYGVVGVGQTFLSASAGEWFAAPRAPIGIWACWLAIFMLAPVVGAALLPVKSDALVLLKDGNITEMHHAVQELEGLGASVLHVFPPRTLICSLPAAVEPAVRGHHAVEMCRRTLMAVPDEAGPLANARPGILGWNRLIAPPAGWAAGGAPPGLPLVGDALPRPPVALGRGPKDGDPSPPPSAYQTSEFMIGKVAVGIIMPESAGNGENWSGARQDLVVQEITAGCNWWATKGGSNAHLTFYYDVRRSVPTQYEPIQRPSTDEGLWISEVLAAMGYPGPSKWSQAYSYVNGLRTRFACDWAFAAFVVDSLNDADGKFTDGFFGYAYSGGPFMVMTYDNDGWGINQMDLVASHEMGHIFGAGDEYCSPGYACCDFNYYGYLGVYNGNCELNNPGSVACMMKDNSPELCQYTLGQIGWRDSDGDGIFDPVDTSVAVTVGAGSSQPPFRFSGTTTDVAYPPGAGHTACTINTITQVEYRLDGGEWVAATPTDGAFNSSEEAFTFAVACAAPGSHQVEVRARNSVGNLGSGQATWSVVTDAIYVDRAYSGPNPNGTICAPFPTVGQGYQAAQNGNTIRIFSGNYNESVVINKTLVLQATNGTVNIIGTP